MELVHLVVGDFEVVRVIFGIPTAFDCGTGFGSGFVNELYHSGIVHQRRRGPVLAYLIEEPVLHRIPFGSACGLPRFTNICPLFKRGGCYRVV